MPRAIATGHIRAVRRRAAVAPLLLFCLAKAVNPQEDVMMKFMLGALAGALAMWYWGDEIRGYIDSRTRDVRDRAVEKLQSVEEKAGAMLDRTKEQVSSTLQAGQDVIRPRVS
jgi:hypothetical protein